MLSRINSILSLLLFIFCSINGNTQSNKVALLNSDSIRNVAAPAFTMQDLDGKEVSLSSLKGKVVVVDFWATWCAPCHQSFPFIEKVMNSYKDDVNVEFLFINSREQAENKIDLVKRFMEKHHHTFKVLFDETGATGKQDKWYREFHTAGLPTRFVIDANGIIRFESIGYPEVKSADELAEILSYMIEEARKFR